MSDGSWIGARRPPVERRGPGGPAPVANVRSIAGRRLDDAEEAAARICIACNVEPAVAAAGYRIVLRCASAAER